MEKTLKLGLIMDIIDSWFNIAQEEETRKMVISISDKSLLIQLCIAFHQNSKFGVWAEGTIQLFISSTMALQMS